MSQIKQIHKKNQPEHKSFTFYLLHYFIKICVHNTFDQFNNCLSFFLISPIVSVSLSLSLSLAIECESVI